MSLSFELLNRSTLCLGDSGSKATLVTVGVNETVHISSILLCNTNSTEETISLYIVPGSAGSPDTPADQHLIIDEYTLDAAGGDFHRLTLQETYILDTAGDTLVGFSTTADKVAVKVFGCVQT